jgi:biopolymer transport protein ExbD
MRRFSQRNQLVTLNEINITPLLDLAFVLLIIFVITTPLLEQSVNLKLPAGGSPDQHLDKNSIRTVEITPQGRYKLAGQWTTPAQMEKDLIAAFRSNPNIFIYIRADENTAYKHVIEVIDRCQKNGIVRYSFRTVPTDRHR